MLDIGIGGCVDVLCGFGIDIGIVWVWYWYWYWYVGDESSLGR
jgi:hypothetical protein